MNVSIGLSSTVIELSNEEPTDEDPVSYFCCSDIIDLWARVSAVPRVRGFLYWGCLTICKFRYVVVCLVPKYSFAVGNEIWHITQGCHYTMPA